MRVLIVDDSPTHRRMLTSLLGRAGHDIVTASNGADALEILESHPVEAVVSDVKMPRLDGFQLCRALRRDPRWARLPFIFYSSIFVGTRAQELGMDLGATAYLDAKHVPPTQVAKEIDTLVNRALRAEYHETLGRLRDDLEFARRYHEVVLSTIDREQHGGVHDSLESNVNALDEILSRLDVERRTLAEHNDVTVPVTELNRLKQLSEELGEKINNPLGVTFGGLDRGVAAVPSGDTSAAVASVRNAVRRINDLVRKMTLRDRSTRE